MQHKQPPRCGDGSTKQERHQYWREVIELYKQQSTLNRREFCDKQGLKIKDFNRWIYRLPPRPLEVDEKGPAEQSVSATDERENGHTTFVPVILPTTPSKDNFQASAKLKDTQFLRLYLKNGMELTIPDHFQSATLLRLLNTLEARSC